MTPEKTKEFNQVKRKVKENKISSYKELKKFSLDYYKKAVEKGYLHELGLKGFLPAGYWRDKEIIQRESKKYSSKKDFVKGSSGAAQAAGLMGIMDEVCSHMEEGKKPEGYYTKEIIIKISKKYKYKSDFRKYDQYACKMAGKLGILRECQKHMIEKPVKKRQSRYSDEIILKRAKDFLFKADFKKEEAGMVAQAKKRGIYQKATAHMKRKPPRRGATVYTDEFLFKLVKKFKTRTALKNSNVSAYRAILRSKNKDKILAKIPVNKSSRKRVDYIVVSSNQSGVRVKEVKGMKNKTYKVIIGKKVFDNKKIPKGLLNKHKTKEKTKALDIIQKNKEKEFLRIQKIADSKPKKQFLKENKKDYKTLSSIGKKTLIKFKREQPEYTDQEIIKLSKEFEYIKDFIDQYGKNNYDRVRKKLGKEVFSHLKPKFKDKKSLEELLKEKGWRFSSFLIKNEEKVLLKLKEVKKDSERLYRELKNRIYDKTGKNYSLVKRKTSIKKTLKKKKIDKREEALKVYKKFKTRQEFELSYPSLCRFVYDHKIKEIIEYFRKIKISSYGELYTKQIFEGLFRVEFKKTKKVLGGLELDGYNENLKLAFEYHGKQHYDYVERFHRGYEGFIKQIERDEKKRLLCKKMGIILIEVPFYIKKKDLQSFIEGELKKAGIKFGKTGKILFLVEDKHLKIKWNKERIIKESGKFNTRNGFREGCKAAYNAARNMGILDEACSHMLSKEEAHALGSLKHRKWTKEAIKKLKCKTSGDLWKKNRSAYNSALNKGWLKELFPDSYQGKKDEKVG